MNTNDIKLLNGSVNVTIHKNYLKDDDSTYAKVKRTTAGMNNIFATILKNSTLMDKASLVAAQILFKDAILDLLQQGYSVNLFELGTLYLSAQGNIENANPSIEEIPSLVLGFTPSEEALSAIKGTDVSMTQLEETNPVINQIEDLLTHKTDCTVTNGMPVRITGRRLKIAGEDEKNGLFFAPQKPDGTIDAEETDWTRIEEEKFFKNTSSYLEFILPSTLTPDTEYSLVLRTSSGRGNRVNKTLRTLIFPKPLTVVSQ